MEAFEAEAVGFKCAIKSFFSGVAEGRMADVVREGEGFCEIGVEAESASEGARSLRDFKRVGETGAEVIAGRQIGKTREDLCFACEPAE